MLENIYKESIKIATQASVWLKENQKDISTKPFLKNKKNPHGGITRQFDLYAEKIIIEHLSKFTNNIFSEEQDWVDRKVDGFFVIIDPVDGSINYLNGNPFYCVSIAGGVADGHICHKDIKWGVVSSPHFGLWSFYHGEGVYYNEENASITPKNGIHIVRYSPAPQEIKFKLFSIGAAALELCFLINGYIDLFVEKLPIKAVDYAAGFGMLNELNFKIYNLRGNALTNDRIKYRYDEGIVVSHLNFNELRNTYL